MGSAKRCHRGAATWGESRAAWLKDWGLGDALCPFRQSLRVRATCCGGSSTGTGASPVTVPSEVLADSLIVGALKEAAPSAQRRSCSVTIVHASNSAETMPYLHVILSVEPQPDKERCVLKDLSDADLKAKFVRPFKRGKNLLCGNEVIPADKIRRIKITSTDETSAVVLAKFQKAADESNTEWNRRDTGLVIIGGLGFGPDELGRIGTDVTTRYITQPPEMVPAPALLARLFNNSWVVTLGGSVIAGIGLAYVLRLLHLT